MTILLAACSDNDDAPLPQGQANLSVAEIFSDRVRVEWDKVENAQRYEVSLNDSVVSTEASLTYTVKGLSPATAYTIGLTPLNSDGKQGDKERVAATTLKREVRIHNSSILLNPFIVAPLVAIVRIGDTALSPDSVEAIRVKVLGKPDGGVAISGTMYPQTAAFKNHFFDIAEDKMFNQTIISDKDSVEIPVLGLYAAYNNTVEYEVETDDHIYKGTANIKTAALRDKNLAVEVAIAKPDKMEPGDATWATGDGYNYDFMCDYKGDVRWIINVRGNANLRILQNGNLLIGAWWNAANFGEYTFLGEEVSVWSLPDGFRNHHDLYEMPSGNFLAPVDRRTRRTEGYTTAEDCILEIHRQTGDIVNYWDLFELMNIKDLQEVWFKDEPDDWYHMNSLYYDDQKDEVIVSGKHGGVIKVSRNGINGDEVNKNKEIVWFMPRFDFYDVYAAHNATKDYILTAVNAAGEKYQEQNIYHEDFRWVKYQHNPTIIPSDDGLLNFLIFNNVYDTGLSSTVQYAVDEKKMTVRQIWEYGSERKDLYSEAWSGSTFLPQTNNRMMFPAPSQSPKVEVTFGKEVVFEFRIKALGPNWYRAGRINLYPKTQE